MPLARPGISHRDQPTERRRPSPGRLGRLAAAPRRVVRVGMGWAADARLEDHGRDHCVTV